jgi:hypothetical protein
MEPTSNIETKEQLIKIIKNWVKTNTEIQAIQSKLNVLKQDKKRVSSELIEVMKNNKIDCFQINNGEIQYKSKNKKKPLSNKRLMDLLNTFYSDDTERAVELNQYLMENKEQTVVENIVMKMDKPK